MRTLAKNTFRAVLNRRAGPPPPDLARRSALVFAPHQDDETLGCGGVIALKRAAGADVRVVFMCDGSASHRNVATPESMRKVRRAEGLAACATLGVQEDHVTFLNYEESLKDAPSSSLDAAGPELLLLIRSMLEREKPHDVFIPYGLDQHTDHRATHRIVRKAAAESGCTAACWEYPIWFWQHWPWTLPILRNGVLGRIQRITTPVRDTARYGTTLMWHLNVRVDIADVIEKKRAALAMHRSQVTRLVDTPRWRTLYDVSEGEFVQLFFEQFEYYRTYPLNGRQA